MTERPSVRQLECFLAVHQVRNFREAAELCFITQPALSAQIQALEQRLGVQLFERDKRRVLPTPAGDELVAYARRILGELDGLADRAHVFCKPLTGELRLGVIPTLAPYLLPPILGPLRELHPDLRLILREEKTNVLLDKLELGELDVLLLALETELRGCATQALFSDPFLVAIPGAHPLAAKESISVQDLKDQPVLLLEEGHCLRDQVLPVCETSGLHEVQAYRASSLGTVVQMVVGGLGLTFVPEVAVPLESRLGNALVLRELEAAGMKRTIGLAWRAASMRGPEFEQLGESIATCYAQS